MVATIARLRRWRREIPRRAHGRGYGLVAGGAAMAGGLAQFV